jgi:uncharacterized protein YbjQ (UPF0145 family)
VSADSPLPIDVRAEMRSAAAWLAAGGAAPNGRAVTSDLTIDEALLLHSIGWEPVELVFGVSVTSVPVGVWTWGRGEIGAASDAHNLAVHTAAERLGRECAKAGGHGVVGVQVSVEVNPHHVDVHLVGTAVRPVEGKKPGQTFVSDLSARDFRPAIERRVVSSGVVVRRKLHLRTTPRRGHRDPPVKPEH